MSRIRSNMIVSNFQWLHVIFFDLGICFVLLYDSMSGEHLVGHLYYKLWSSLSLWWDSPEAEQLQLSVTT